MPVNMSLLHSENENVFARINIVRLLCAKRHAVVIILHVYSQSKAKYLRYCNIFYS